MGKYIKARSSKRESINQERDWSFFIIGWTLKKHVQAAVSPVLKADSCSCHSQSASRPHFHSPVKQSMESRCLRLTTCRSSVHCKRDRWIYREFTARCCVVFCSLHTRNSSQLTQSGWSCVSWNCFLSANTSVWLKKSSNQQRRSLMIERPSLHFLSTTQWKISLGACAVSEAQRFFLRWAVAHFSTLTSLTMGQ